MIRPLRRRTAEESDAARLGVWTPFNEIVVFFVGTYLIRANVQRSEILCGEDNGFGFTWKARLGNAVELPRS